MNIEGITYNEEYFRSIGKKKTKAELKNNPILKLKGKDSDEYINKVIDLIFISKEKEEIQKEDEL